MSMPSTPDGMLPGMNGIDEMTRAWQSAVPAEFAGAVNLMAHPIAGAAAAGALGLGFASHAFGLWMGAAVGAAEVSHRMLAGVARSEPTPPKPRKPARPAGSVRTVTTKAPEAAVAVAEKGKARAADAGSRKAADDLKAISGIGPKLEKVLNDLGITTYAQVVALTEAEVARLDEQLGFAGRILRDDWIGQARKLAAGA